MNFFEVIGRNIQIELDGLGWTKSALAEKIGVSRQVFQKIISGKKAINVFEISEIAKALGTTADALINNKRVDNNINPEVLFMGQFTKELNFNFIKSIIEEYMDMEEDLSELKRLNNLSYR